MTTKSLQGSDFAKLLLNQDFKSIKCAVSDISDNDAFGTFGAIDNSRIVTITNRIDGAFIDSNGNAWLFAVPVLIRELTQLDL